jgi:hypothetical protein
MQAHSSFGGDPGRVVILSTYFPTSLKPRLAAFTRMLATRVELHLVHADEPPGLAAPLSLQKRHREELESLGVRIHRLPVQWPRAALKSLGRLALGLSIHGSLYVDRRLAGHFREICDQLKPDVVHIDRLRAVPIARQVSVPKVVDLTDPVGWVTKQRAATSAGWRAWLRTLESRTLWQDEGAVVRSAITLFATEFGAEICRSPLGGADVRFVGHPTVQMGYPTKTKFEGSGVRLCFAGNLGYWPNLEGMTEFMTHKWPVIRDRVEGVTLSVLGSSPPRKFLHLAARQRVAVQYNLPDLLSVMRGADLAIVPLSQCGGFSNKVADAIVGVGIPVLATEATVRGMPSSVRSLIPCANTTNDWVSQIDSFRRDPAPWWGSVDKARGLFANELAPEKCSQDILEIYRHAIAQYMQPKVSHISRHSWRVKHLQVNRVAIR